MAALVALLHPHGLPRPQGLPRPHDLPRPRHLPRARPEQRRQRRVRRQLARRRQARRQVRRQLAQRRRGAQRPLVVVAAAAVLVAATIEAVVAQGSVARLGQRLRALRRQPWQHARLGSVGRLTCRLRSSSARSGLRSRCCLKSSRRHSRVGSGRPLQHHRARTRRREQLVLRERVEVGAWPCLQRQRVNLLWMTCLLNSRWKLRVWNRSAWAACSVSVKRKRRTIATHSALYTCTSYSCTCTCTCTVQYPLQVACDLCIQLRRGFHASVLS